MITYSNLIHRLNMLNFDFYIQKDLYDIFKDDKKTLDTASGICIFSAYISCLDAQLHNGRIKKFFKETYNIIYDRKNKGNTSNPYFFNTYFNRIFKEYFDLDIDVFKLVNYTKEIKTFPFILGWIINVPMKHAGHATLATGIEGKFIKFKDNSFMPGIKDTHKIPVTKVNYLLYVLERLFRKNTDVINFFELTEDELNSINFKLYKPLGIATIQSNLNLLYKAEKVFNKILKKLFNQTIDEYYKDNLYCESYINIDAIDLFAKKRHYVVLTDEFINSKIQLNKLINDLNFIKKIFNKLFKHKKYNLEITKDDIKNTIKNPENLTVNIKTLYNRLITSNPSDNSTKLHFAKFINILMTPLYGDRKEIFKKLKVIDKENKYFEKLYPFIKYELIINEKLKKLRETTKYKESKLEDRIKMVKDLRKKYKPEGDVTQTIKEIMKNMFNLDIDDVFIKTKCLLKPVLIKEEEI